MCGIVGYIGIRSACECIITGLKHLEYRGYDSAGIALLKDGSFFLKKKKGRLHELEAILGDVAEVNDEGLGIGHTRWATHGVPSDENAHPLCDCDQTIMLVHNGIIENFTGIRRRLISEGHQFRSDTDTEVIAHLLEESYKVLQPKTRGDRIKLIRKVLNQFRGTYALALLFRDDPDTLYGARKASPLIIGMSQEGHFLASDVPAVLPYTRKVMYLQDEDIAVLTRDGVEVYDAGERPCLRESQTVEWTLESAEKHGYETFMLKEIEEQPEVIERMIQNRIPTSSDLPHLNGLNECLGGMSDIDRVVIVACGTAYHAGYIGQYLIEHFASLPVAIDVASEFRYRKPKVNNRTLMIVVSQSGETADTIAAMDEAKERGCRIISICNVLGSTIPRKSHAVVYTHAGPEIGVASTKAYTAQLAMFVLLTIYIARSRNEMTREDAEFLYDELRNLPQKIRTILNNKEQIQAIAEEYYQAPSAIYLGRGFNYPNALEGALKNKEISYMHAEGFAAGEMKHGPIALIDETMPVICICPMDFSYEKMLSNMREVQSRYGKIIAIATEGDNEVAEISKNVIYIPAARQEVSPILVAIPMQLLAYYIADKKGCDIDKPRNLAKSVTVE